MPDRVAEHYERHAHAFDKARSGQFNEKAWFDRFLIGVRRGGAILDLGCGAGEPVDRYLIDHGYPVTGLDISDKMVSLARIRFPRHQWMRHDMRKAELVGQFAGIVAWDSLFHLPHADQTAMIARIGGWLERDGNFLFNTGPAHGVAIGEQFDEALYHASLDPHEYQKALADAGLRVVAFSPEDAIAGGRTVWLVRKLG
jgi:cyclopropane fatty-acyl-phospholipid synthase-like methyltransferase